MIINKSEIEVTDFLRSSFKNPVTIKSFLGETSLYNVSYDYDQFIITKQAKPFHKNGILEVQACIKISRFDNNYSQIESSIRYSFLSILLIVFFNLIISTVPFFVTNYRFFGETIKIKNFPERILIVIIGVVLFNFFIWIGFLIKKDGYQRIVDQIIKSIKNDGT